MNTTNPFIIPSKKSFSIFRASISDSNILIENKHVGKNPNGKIKLTPSAPP